MKKIYSILLILVFLLSPITASSTSVEVNKDAIFLGSIKSAMKSGLFTLMNTVDVTGWLPSDNGQSGYGKGRFFYKITRTVSPDKAGYYYFEIRFLSDSYYPANFYNSGQVYRSATKIDNMSLFVDNRATINMLTNSQVFWLLFQGDFERGTGDLGIYFKTQNPNCRIDLRWTQPKPY